ARDRPRGAAADAGYTDWTVLLRGESPLAVSVWWTSGASYRRRPAPVDRPSDRVGRPVSARWPRERFAPAQRPAPVRLAHKRSKRPSLRRLLQMARTKGQVNRETQSPARRSVLTLQELFGDAARVNRGVPAKRPGCHQEPVRGLEFLTTLTPLDKHA